MAVSPMREAVLGAAIGPCRPEGEGWRQSYRPDASFAGFSGHFPGHPVLPALVQLLMVQHTLELGTGRKMPLHALTQAKFLAPVFPCSMVDVAVSSAPHGGWNAELTANGQTVSRLSFQTNDGGGVTKNGIPQKDTATVRNGAR